MSNEKKGLHKILIGIKNKLLNSPFGLIWFVFIVFLTITGIYCLVATHVNPAIAYNLWFIPKCIIVIGIFIIVLLFLTKPMNAVYGLMGTTGSVNIFFLNFVIISLLFAMIYHFGFFHNAAVSYDVNQPHIYYNCPDSVIINGKNDSETTLLVHVTNNGTEVKDTIYQIHEFKYNYQSISFWDTFRNTIMTTLMQEPTDFFAIASTHNEAMDKGRELCLDKDKAAMFHWLLIIQILISWIFFGVFISILYNKFRYES